MVRAWGVKVVDGAGCGMSARNNRQDDLAMAKLTKYTSPLFYRSSFLLGFLTTSPGDRKQIGISNYLNKATCQGRVMLFQMDRPFLNMTNDHFPFSHTMTLSLLAHPVHRTVEASDGAYRGVVV